jgi:hypothetical protein
MSLRNSPLSGLLPYEPQRLLVDIFIINALLCFVKMQEKGPSWYWMVHTDSSDEFVVILSRCVGNEKGIQELNYFLMHLSDTPQLQK